MIEKLRHKTIKVVTLLTIVMLVVTVAFMSLIAYWSFTGEDALSFNKEPLPVKPKFVKSEEIVTLTADFCKLTSAPGEVERLLVSDKTEISSPTAVDSQPEGCYQYDIPVPIPPQTPPGKYHIVFRVTYQTNPLKEVSEEVHSEEFEIVE